MPPAPVVNAQRDVCRSATSRFDRTDAGEPGIEQRLEISAAGESTAYDHRRAFTSTRNLRGVGNTAQHTQIVGVLRTEPIVAREQLQYYQVPHTRDGHTESREHLDRFSGGGNLGLDAGRREEEISDDTGGGLTGCHEPDGSEPGGALVLDHCRRPEPVGDEGTHERFCGCIRGDVGGDVESTRETRLRTDRHRNAAHERKAYAAATELSRDALEGRMETVLQGRRGQVPGRPAASPCSAPGRSWSHDTSRLSISSGVAAGYRRRRFWRMISSAAAKSSSISR